MLGYATGLKPPATGGDPELSSFQFALPKRLDLTQENSHGRWWLQACLLGNPSAFRMLERSRDKRWEKPSPYPTPALAED